MLCKQDSVGKGNLESWFLIVAESCGEHCEVLGTLPGPLSSGAIRLSLRDLWVRSCHIWPITVTQVKGLKSVY